MYTYMTDIVSYGYVFNRTHSKVRAGRCTYGHGLHICTRYTYVRTVHTHIPDAFKGYATGNMYICTHTFAKSSCGGRYLHAPPLQPLVFLYQHLVRLRTPLCELAVPSVIFHF